MTEFEIVKQNGVKWEPTRLSLTKRMDLDEAGRFIHALDTMESCSSWWIGSFLNQMEAIHGEAYAQLIPEGKAHTWPVYKWVESRVKPELRRNPNVLSFSHHQVVASLLSERQRVFLDRAETEGLSVSSLKALIKAEKGKTPKDSVTRLITCPKCDFSWEEIQK